LRVEPADAGICADNHRVEKDAANRACHPWRYPERRMSESLCDDRPSPLLAGVRVLAH